MNYSEKIKRIEEILRAMDDPSVPFEHMMKLYDEGQKLFTECGKFLTKAEGKVKKLEEDGSVTDFEEQ